MNKNLTDQLHEKTWYLGECRSENISYSFFEFKLTLILILLLCM